MAREHYVKHDDLVAVLNGIETKISGIGSELTGISTWKANNQYKIGDVVITNGSMFICNAVHTSSVNFAADVLNWILFYADISPWQVSTYYVVNACVIQGGKLYQCKTAHTSDTTDFTNDESNWTLIAGGGGSSISDWATNTDYKVGDMVIYDKKLYKCAVAHKSATDIDGEKFELIGSNGGIEKTILYEGDLKVAGTTATLSDNPHNYDIVYVSDNYCVTCIAEWSDTTSDPFYYWQCSSYFANSNGYRLGGRIDSTKIYLDSFNKYGTQGTSASIWRVVGLKFRGEGSSSSGGATIDNWTSGENYNVGDLVIYNDKLYQCITAHTSTTTFDPNVWNLIGTNDGGGMTRKVLYDGNLSGAGSTAVLTDAVENFDMVYVVDSWGNSNIAEFDTSSNPNYYFSSGAWFGNSNAYGLAGHLKGYTLTIDHHGKIGTQGNQSNVWRVIGVKFNTGSGGGASISDWEANKEYNIGDYVRYDNILYVCKTKHTSTTTFDETKFNAIKSPSDATLNVAKIRLWEGQAGTGDTITLSESVANFDYILCHIYWANNSSYTSVYHEGFALIDSSSLDGTEGRVPYSFSGATDWTSHANLDYKLQLDKISNTVFSLGTNSINLKLPTSTAAGVYLGKVEGLKFKKDATDTPDFTGATSVLDGDRGLVPKPLSVDKDSFLSGDGTWKPVSGQLNVGRALLWSGRKISGQITLTGSIQDYDYIIASFVWAENDSVTAQKWNNGYVVYDVSSGNYGSQIVPGDDLLTGLTLNSWANLQNSATEAYFSVVDNTTLEFGVHKMSAPTSTTQGYYFNKVEGIKLYSGAGDAPDFVGSTSTTDGIRGAVPKPTKDDNSKFLCGNGTWATPSGAGLNVVRDLLWEGWKTSDIATGSPEPLAHDFREYDYLVFEAGYSSAGAATEIDYTRHGSVWVEVNGDTMLNPCPAFMYNGQATSANAQWLFCDLDFTAKTSFSGGIKRYKGTNTTTGLYLGLRKIYGVKFVNPLEYSTSEKYVGKWIDGKAIYQRTFTGTSPSSAGEAGEIILANMNYIDTVISVDGCVKTSGGAYWPLNSGNSYTAYARISSTKNLVVTATSDSLNISVTVTVRYTRT